ncbi:TPA: AAA family ATPase [Aeromonas veronii]
MIEFISIHGLHGERDVTLNFDGNIKIIIGDNGSGKTTVLSALYAILSQNFHKLSKIDFECIEVLFSSGENIVIKKDSLGIGKYIELLEHSALEGLNNIVSPDELLELLRTISKVSYPKVQHITSFRNLARKSRWSSRELYERLSYVARRIFNDENETDISDEIKEVINRNVSGNLLYLPTYRRVEEGLNTLGYLEDDFSSADQLIQFGMNDVKARFRKIKNELKDSAVKLYTNLNGKMLTQLASDYKASEHEFEKIRKTDELKIVLSRVGDSISESTKQRILDLISNGVIQQERYHPLVFVLSNLVDVYLEQKETDDAIKLFVDVANRYLVNKEVIYDENNVDIKVTNKKTKTEVDLENLSSGEKQFISLFSKLYLDKINDYIIIFDEPELSLSIEWQATLLPDIIDSKRCKFLVAATHSPFIFDNILDNKTGIIEVVREYEPLEEASYE